MSLNVLRKGGVLIRGKSNAHTFGGRKKGEENIIIRKNGTSKWGRPQAL